jgi:hypothetical protein
MRRMSPRLFLGRVDVGLGRLFFADRLHLVPGVHLRHSPALTAFWCVHATLSGLGLGFEDRLTE